jgi:hypothetical protein
LRGSATSTAGNRTDAGKLLGAVSGGQDCGAPLRLRQKYQVAMLR